MLHVCHFCEKEFEGKQSRKFCSHECVTNSQKTGVFIPCEQCGGPAFKRPSHIKPHIHHFCSYDCHNLYQKENGYQKQLHEVVCGVCQKVFIHHALTRRFCSKKCGNVYKNKQQQENKNPNKLEILGYSLLEKLNYTFERQKLLHNKILVDAFIPKSNTVIQFDGNYWHGHPNSVGETITKSQRIRIGLDKSQDAYLKKVGYKIVRFWESDIHRIYNDSDLDYMKEKING